MERSSIAIALVAGASFSIGSALAEGRPTAVSPGDPARATRIESRCPTFSWWAPAGASDYELVVFDVREPDDPGEPVLRETIAGPAFAWTPDLERCLERGGRYAWSLRILGEPGSEWSEPRQFEVASGPTDEELRAALGIVRDYLARRGPGAERSSAVAAVAGGLDAPPSEEGLLPRPAAEVVIDQPAALHVDGEVRTVDEADQPRLWGRGRRNAGVFTSGAKFGCVNGDISFGLSRLIVDWGSAADACPAGTWVCRGDEVVACDTERLDNPSTDWFNCDGSSHSYAPDAHSGWVADAFEDETLPTTLYGALRSESGGAGFGISCSYRPVWCCWE